MSKYNVFTETADRFNPRKVDAVHKELPSGAYSPWVDPNTGQVYFDKIDINVDNIVDLPSKEYEYVVNQMSYFLKDSTKDKYKDNGFLYKRSALLYGKPGTGKSVIISRVTKEALEKGAVVLFNPNPAKLSEFYSALDSTNPNRLTVVIFEEIDETLKRQESPLLSVLDGEVQKNNVMYLATTNYIDKVPLRIQRPGRFSSIVEVGFPTALAREVYLKTKQVDLSMLKSWVNKTEGFSIDELKETVLAVKCLDEPLEVVIKRIKELKGSEESKEKKDVMTSLDEAVQNRANSMIQPVSFAETMVYYKPKRH